MSELIVDVVFGVGLIWDISGDVCVFFDRINVFDVLVLLVDLFSGVNGDIGKIFGICLLVDVMVIFVCKKFGYVFMFGCFVCGEIEVVDIGIFDWVI